MFRVSNWIAIAACAIVAPLARAQHSTMDHAAHMAARRDSVARPTQSGQSAFASIAEIVRILEADSATDWRRVNLAALRQHLLDMDEVVMRARISEQEIPGGVRVDFTGDGKTLASIQRMITAHGAALGESPDLAVRVEALPAGVRWYATSRSATPASVARLRGLGGIGLLTAGDHHARHHLAIARGERMDEHAHGK